MRYCLYCKRINPGEPLYCQYCGKTFEARICSKCHHINPKEALVCRNCGSSELSDIAGPLPLWLVILRIFFWIFIVLLVIGFLVNLDSFVPLFIVIGLLLIGYSFLPEEGKKILKTILNFFKQCVWGKKEKS